MLFAVGAVSGTVLSFEFGLLWPGMMGRFGDGSASPFAIEGISSSSRRSSSRIYIYGWNRLPPRAHFWSGVPIAIVGRRRQRSRSSPRTPG